MYNCLSVLIPSCPAYKRPSANHLIVLLLFVRTIKSTQLSIYWTQVDSLVDYSQSLLICSCPPCDNNARSMGTKGRMRLLWEKRDACVGNEWDSSGLWANMQGRPDVFTGLLYYLECIYVSMMHGRNDQCATKGLVYCTKSGRITSCTSSIPTTITNHYLRSQSPDMGAQVQESDKG